VPLHARDFESIHTSEKRSSKMVDKSCTSGTVEAAGSLAACPQCVPRAHTIVPDMSVRTSVGAVGLHTSSQLPSCSGSHNLDRIETDMIRRDEQARLGSIECRCTFVQSTGAPGVGNLPATDIAEAVSFGDRQAWLGIPAGQHTIPF